jgi:hypothetical protein
LTRQSVAGIGGAGGSEIERATGVGSAGARSLLEAAAGFGTGLIVAGSGIGFVPST